MLCYFLLLLYNYICMYVIDFNLYITCVKIDFRLTMLTAFYCCEYIKLRTTNLQILFISPF